MDGAEVLIFQGNSEAQFPQQTPQMSHYEFWTYINKEHVKFKLYF